MKAPPIKLFILLAVVAAVLVYFMMSPNSYHYRLHSPRQVVESNLLYDKIKKQVLEPMVMSLDYWEQFANALAGLSDLQCWANTVGITKVMEPFIQLSSASAFHFLPKSNALTLGDLIDIDAWNKMSLKRSVSTLVSLKTFLDDAVRDIVFVQIIFKLLVHLPCQPMSHVKETQWYKYFTGRGFHVVDTVCIDLEKEPNYTLTAETFQDQIFAKKFYNVSLVFNIWTGIRREYCGIRVCLKESYCNDVRRAMHMKLLPSIPHNVTYQYVHKSISARFVPPSLRVSNCVDRFKSEFMSGAQYVAVMIRSEKLSNSIISSPQAWNKCMTTILSDWKKVLANTTNLKTLFFTDASAHGSATLNNKQAVRFSQELEHSLHLEHHLSEVNQYLERTSGSKNSVLIATLQREIVAQAKCVIMVGGAGFQRLTLHIYAHYHSGEELCYSYRKKTCESLFLDTG